MLIAFAINIYTGNETIANVKTHVTTFKGGGILALSCVIGISISYFSLLARKAVSATSFTVRVATSSHATFHTHLPPLDLSLNLLLSHPSSLSTHPHTHLTPLAPYAPPLLPTPPITPYTHPHSLHTPLPPTPTLTSYTIHSRSFQQGGRQCLQGAHSGHQLLHLDEGASLLIYPQIMLIE
jgi:hypothetical protein